MPEQTCPASPLPDLFGKTYYLTFTRNISLLAKDSSDSEVSNNILLDDDKSEDEESDHVCAYLFNCLRSHKWSLLGEIMP